MESVLHFTGVGDAAPSLSTQSPGTQGPKEQDKVLVQETPRLDHTSQEPWENSSCDNPLLSETQLHPYRANGEIWVLVPERLNRG